MAVDGRTARRERTRSAILTALGELLREGELSPKADSIARRAGVSLRSIYQHFSDLEELFEEVSRTQLGSLLNSKRHIAPTLPVGERIDQLVAARADAYASIAPIARAAFLHERTSRQVARSLAAVRRALRAEVADIFASELAALSETDRRDRVHAMSSATSFAVYDLLMEREQVGHESYLRITGCALRGLLSL